MQINFLRTTMLHKKVIQQLAFSSYLKKYCFKTSKQLLKNPVSSSGNTGLAGRSHINNRGKYLSSPNPSHQWVIEYRLTRRLQGMTSGLLLFARYYWASCILEKAL